jgi:hypothetical protein
MQIPAGTAAGAGNNRLSSWLDEELSAIQTSKKREAESAARAAAEEASKPAPTTAPKTKSKRRKKKQTLKQAVIRAVITTVTVVILCVGGGAAGVWYIQTHPVEGATPEARASRLRQRIGTITALGMALPWLIFALNYRKLTKKT